MNVIYSIVKLRTKLIKRKLIQDLTGRFILMNINVGGTDCCCSFFELICNSVMACYSLTLNLTCGTWPTNLAGSTPTTSEEHHIDLTSLQSGNETYDGYSIRPFRNSLSDICFRSGGNRCHCRGNETMQHVAVSSTAVPRRDPRLFPSLSSSTAFHIRYIRCCTSRSSSSTAFHFEFHR